MGGRRFNFAGISRASSGLELALIKVSSTCGSNNNPAESTRGKHARKAERLAYLACSWLDRSSAPSFPTESAPTFYGSVNFSRKASPSIAFFLRIGSAAGNVDARGRIIIRHIPARYAAENLQTLALSSPTAGSVNFSRLHTDDGHSSRSNALTSHLREGWSVGFTMVTCITSSFYFMVRATIFLKNIEISMRVRHIYTCYYA
jgi:hypothetical protein